MPMLAPTMTVWPARLIRRAQRVDDPLPELFGRRRQVGRLEGDRELVAAQPRDDVGAPQAAQQPAARRLQQRVADRMAQRVVDMLEPVQIEIQQRQSGVAVRQVADHLVQPDAEQHAVGQFRQRIVVRGEADMFLGPPLLRHVFIGRDPAAIGDRPLRHGDRLAAFAADDERAGLPRVGEAALLQIDGLHHRSAGIAPARRHLHEDLVRSADPGANADGSIANRSRNRLL